MKIEELKNELNEITRIFLSAKYYELDFRYFHSIKYSQPVVYSTFYFLIERIFHSISVALILDLCKLYDKREKFSIVKLKNKILDNYERSELNSYLTLKEIKLLFDSVDSDEIEQILKKLKETRDKYYAHFDRTRPNFINIQINSSETRLLISISEELLKSINLNFFDVSIDYDLDKYELGHNIFKRLEEWEKYREKYGILNRK